LSKFCTEKFINQNLQKKTDKKREIKMDDEFELEEDNLEDEEDLSDLELDEE